MDFVKIFAHLCSTSVSRSVRVHSQVKPVHCFSVTFTMSKKCSSHSKYPVLPSCWLVFVLQVWASLAAFDRRDPNSFRFLICFSITCSSPFTCALFGREHFKAGCVAKIPVTCCPASPKAGMPAGASSPPSTQGFACRCWSKLNASSDMMRMSTSLTHRAGALFLIPCAELGVLLWLIVCIWLHQETQRGGCRGGKDVWCLK